MEDQKKSGKPVDKGLEGTSFFPDLDTHLEIKERQAKRDKEAKSKGELTVSEKIARWDLKS